MSDRDASLRRVERDAILVCGVMAVTALALQGGRLDGALGVIGGGALMAVSYRAIKGGVTALVNRAETAAATPEGARAPSPRQARAMLSFVLRYALLAAGAYVILIPLRAHPLGVVSGVTAPVVAIGLEAARLQRRPRG